MKPAAFLGPCAIYTDADAIPPAVMAYLKKSLVDLQNGALAIDKRYRVLDDGTTVLVKRIGSQYQAVVEVPAVSASTQCSCVEKTVGPTYIELTCPESTGVVSRVLKSDGGTPPTYTTSPLQWDWMGAAPFDDKVYIFLAREESAATFPFATTYYMRIVVFDTKLLTFTLVFDGLHPLSTGAVPWATTASGGFRGAPMYAYKKNGQLRIIVGGTNFSNSAFTHYGFMTQVFEYVIGTGVVEHYAADVSAIGTRTHNNTTGGDTYPQFLLRPPVDNSSPGVWKQVTFAPVFANDGTPFLTTYDFIRRKWTTPVNMTWDSAVDTVGVGGFLGNSYLDISPQNGPGLAQPWMLRYSIADGTYKQIALPFAQFALIGAEAGFFQAAQICCCVLVAGGQQDNTAFGTLASNRPDIWSVNLETSKAKHVGLMPWGSADPWNPVAGDTDKWVDTTSVVPTVNGFAVFTTSNVGTASLIPVPGQPNNYYQPNVLRAFMVE